MIHPNEVNKAIQGQIESCESALLHIDRYDLNDAKTITGLLLDLLQLERYYREVPS
jgi:hypothetical protein